MTFMGELADGTFETIFIAHKTLPFTVPDAATETESVRSLKNILINAKCVQYFSHSENDLSMIRVL